MSFEQEKATALQQLLAESITAVDKLPFSSPSGTAPLYRQEQKSLSRKDSRKVSHSLIEKRRREKINSCLSKLKSIVPGCAAHGEGIQKLKILEMTVDYILSLQISSHAGGKDLEQEIPIIQHYPLSPSPSLSACPESNSFSGSPMALASILNL
jgi:Helix-loop-helix DNA-binding domain